MTVVTEGITGVSITGPMMPGRRATEQPARHGENVAPDALRADLHATYADSGRRVMPHGVVTLGPTFGEALRASAVRKENGRVNVVRTGALFGKAAVAATVVLPSNEVMRAGLTVGALVASGGNPIVGGLAAAGSTFLLEAAGGWAAADLANTPVGNWLFRKANAKLGERKLRNPSLLTEAGITLLGGTVVGMLVKQAQNPDRTRSQNHRYSLLTSAWLAGAVAVAGTSAFATAAEVLKKPAVAITSAMGAATIWAIGRERRRARLYPEWANSDTRWNDRDRGVAYSIASEPADLAKAAVIAQKVWDGSKFGNLHEEGYTPLMDRARVFTAMREDGGECVGATYMFNATRDGTLPFLGLPFDNNRQHKRLLNQARSGELEELGITGVTLGLRGQHVNDSMWRLAFRDAIARGVKKWGIIMEPERVEKMNRLFGFAFRQLGPAVRYQGGYCAAFVMDMDELAARLYREKPKLHAWYMKEPLRP